MKKSESPSVNTVGSTIRWGRTLAQQEVKMPDSVEQGLRRLEDKLETMAS